MPSIGRENIRDQRGTETSLYYLPFGAHGEPFAHETREAFLRAASEPDVEHVIVLSHGWNNDFATARVWYRRMLDEFNATYTGARPRVIAAGIVWPSVVLVAPWEATPRFAGPELAGWSPDLGVEPWTVRERLGVREARSLITHVLERIGNVMDDEVSGGPHDAEVDRWLELWMSSRREYVVGDDSLDDWIEPEHAAHDERALVPDAAGALRYIDPRWVLRLLTVLHMKDRAGVVGRAGLAPLLDELLGRSGAAVHLVGHSYGAKLTLSAMRHAVVPRPVRSLLLLQAAVSRFCFAPDADGHGRPGGYHGVPARVDLPVVTTWSEHDVPLRTLFHLVCRRARDLGEPGHALPMVSRWAALGGYGPVHVPSTRASELGRPYALRASPGLLSIDASAVIAGHGDIANAATARMLRALIDARVAQ